MPMMAYPPGYPMQIMPQHLGYFNHPQPGFYGQHSMPYPMQYPPVQFMSGPALCTQLPHVVVAHGTAVSSGLGIAAGVGDDDGIAA